MTIIGFEVYAIALALLQFQNGVRTDEAKYLLNIPYPHPPFVRTILSSIDGWAHQELFWRIVFATLMVQAVWLVMDLAMDLSVRARRTLAICWLLSAALMSQAGTVMMAPMTALQGLVFIWIAYRPKNPSGNTAGLIALFWLISLFTAYQAVLFAPVALAALWRTKQPWWRVALYVGVPIALLVLYTAANPLAAASMFIHAGKDASQTLATRLLETARIAALGGSVIASVLGTLTLAFERKWSLIGSLLLVTFYILLSRFDYYAILFTPIFCAGVALMLRPSCRMVWPLHIGVPLCAAILLWLYPPILPAGPAPVVMGHIQEHAQPGTVLLDWSFGHEWQHASEWPVQRYSSSALEEASVIVCRDTCKEPPAQGEWEPMHMQSIDVWVRR